MFQLKQFTIDDSSATMKVGTDAILLGAMAGTTRPLTHILDIGTGCGILALMMAQRFPDATVDAIDIDNESTALASRNAQRSLWSDRIHCHNTSLQDFTLQTEKNYDLIISNPPYFNNSLRNANAQRRFARHDDTLPPALLFECSHRLLDDGGIMWIIIPSIELERFANAAQKAAMHMVCVYNVCTSPNKPPKLSICSLSKKNVAVPVASTYYMRDGNNQYSDWYRQVTEPFLLWK